MQSCLNIGIIGDFNPKNRTHLATNASILHAADAKQQHVAIEWIPTLHLDHRGTTHLSAFQALWCSPGSPYTSMSGALTAIQFAREANIPFFGTWGGFQHTLVEYARNVLGLVTADHEESAPDATMLLISRLACSLVGQTQSIQLVPSSQVAAAYGQVEAVEDFYCNYGFNPAFAAHFQHSDLNFVAFDQEGELRAVELRGHPFYVATLFLPQMRSQPGQPHPLILAYLQAASTV